MEEVEGKEINMDVKGKVDTYTRAKLRANIEGLDDSELARILQFLPRQVKVYIYRKHLRIFFYINLLKFNIQLKGHVFHIIHIS